jgi:hypothetical protein
VDVVYTVGDGRAEGAVLDPQGVRVGEQTRFLDPPVELLRGQGPEREEVPVDLVVFVRELDVVVAEAHESAWIASTRKEVDAKEGRQQGRSTPGRAEVVGEEKEDIVTKRGPDGRERGWGASCQ